MLQLALESKTRKLKTYQEPPLPTPTTVRGLHWVPIMPVRLGMTALTRPSALIPAAEVGEARVPQHWMGPVLQLFLRAGEAMAVAAKAATMMTVILENIF